MSDNSKPQSATAGVSINGRWRDFSDTDPATPLLWFLREQCGLTGSKYGCGIGSCGACTVLLEQGEGPSSRFQAVRACVTPISALIAGDLPPARVITIEGLTQRYQQGMASAHSEQHCQPPQHHPTPSPDTDSSTDASADTGCPHPVQSAWNEQQVPQCGYCQSGQILSAVALLQALAADGGAIDDQQINQAMAGNLCRCGTYPRIRKAIKQAATEMNIEVSA